MSASRRRISLLILLLVLSIGGKVLAGNQSLSGAEDDLQNTTAMLDQVGLFLQRNGFGLGEVEGKSDIPFVRAFAGDCHVVVVLAAPQGWHRDVTRQFASPGDQVFFVFHATIFDNQPRWPPWLHHYWQVLNHYVGRHVHTRPLLGVAASSTCDLRDLPWKEVAEVS